MTKKLIYLLLVTVMTAGCALDYTNAPQRKVIQQAHRLTQSTQAQTVHVVQQAYLGATPIKLETGKELPPIFSKQITLRTRGTLTELVNTIQNILPLGIKYASVTGATTTKSLQASTSKSVAINYRGTVENLMNTIGQHFGQSWEYKNGIVEFSFLQVKTFTLLTAPGQVTYEGTITNKTETKTSGSGSAASAGSSSQTAQSSKNKYQADAWAECEAGVKALLSKRGSVSISKASGTITVSDTAPALRRVEKYIEKLNTKLGKQVALSIHVWSLELTNNTDASLNLKVLLEGSGVKLASTVVNPYQLLDGASTLTAGIIGGGALSGSEAVLRALKQKGRTTLLTSGSGISMNNQPLPVQVDRRIAYLAGTKTTTTNDSSSTELTPGEVSPGFAMAVIPHILDRRRVILQYNVSLSSLDRLVEFASGGQTIQLPQLSTRSFAQRVGMNMGQTLVLAGFEQERGVESAGMNVLSAGQSAQKEKRLIVITIDVESAGDLNA